MTKDDAVRVARNLFEEQMAKDSFPLVMAFITPEGVVACSYMQSTAVSDEVVLQILDDMKAKVKEANWGGAIGAQRNGLC